jgi:nicotinamide-nucleotide amidase
MINPELISTCTQLLIEKGLTIAFAESATAGRICAEFALAEHAGQFLKGGLNCYDATLKEDLLGVKHSLVELFTPESAIITRAITEGLARLIPADIHVGCTGLTCAGGSETEQKPVGTMFLYATINGNTLFNYQGFFEGSPEDIVFKTVEKTASLLIAGLGQAGGTSGFNS